MYQHPMRNTAEDPLREPGPPVCTHDNQVSLFVPWRLQACPQLHVCALQQCNLLRPRLGVLLSFSSITLSTRHPSAIALTCSKAVSANYEPSRGTTIFLYTFYLPKASDKFLFTGFFRCPLHTDLQSPGSPGDFSVSPSGGPSR